MESRARTRLLESTLAVAALAVTLALVELGLRLSGWVPAAYPGAACIFDADRRLLLDGYPSNPRGYFDLDLRDAATLERYRRARVKRLERAAARAPFAVELRYNSFGWRGPEPPPRRAGVRRVAVLGDSFTEGQGVKEGDTFPRVLERLLEARAPGRYEVLNCGRRASDFPELRAALEPVLDTHPDLVIYAMVPNDAEAGPELRRRWRDLADLISDRHQGELSWAYERLGPFESRLATLLRGRLRAARLRRDSLRAYRDLYGPSNVAAWGRTQAAVRDMAAAARARGAGFVLALWPLLVDLDGVYPLAEVNAAAAELCARAGIDFVDLLPVLQGRPSSSLWVHPIDHHPNEQAHRLVAGRLVSATLAKLP